ncbi:MAG: chromosome segregation protein SMC [Sporolactobacillus sp.]
MFLKRLDVSGFKSFANKTSIEFVPGVTAVVGPNGSGKSNITEAVRWVLGEQSAKSLRGSKMEDIIFSGSDARKAVNLAEVTLILDNSDHYLSLDYSELSVSRRVYRSGESEYLLNGQNCRLKDVIDLFMDSGLGKEAYSVIGQGKIDEILNSKAEDKRKIFEEASGVLKYKLRKQAAEKQLDDSEDNLNRVEDILHELHSRLGPLEEQAAIAKDYLVKKEELKNTDVALLAYDIRQLHEEWENTGKKASHLSERKKQIELASAEREESFRKNRLQLEQLEKAVDRLQHESAEAGELLEKIIGQKEVMNERRKHAKSTLLELKERLSHLREQLANEEQELAVSGTNYQTENKKLRQLRQQLSEKERLFSSDPQDMEERIDQLKSQYIEVLNRQAALHNEQRYLSGQQQTLHEKKNRAASGTEDLRRSADAARQKKNELDESCKQKMAMLSELQKTVRVNESQLKQANEHYQQQKTAVEKIDRIIEQVSSRKEILEAMQEDYAGFFQGVKAVLTHRKDLRGIYGAVAELIHVASAHQLAIETALGGSAQSVIVSDEEAGRRAIQYLRQHKAGRATFLPLTVMRAREIGAAEKRRIEQNPAFIGVAKDLVRTAPLHQPAIAHLLGHVVIASDLAGANQLAKLLNYRYRMVTLEGDVVAPGGAMTGGSVNKNRSGVIGRSSEIETLKGQIREMQSKSSELKNAFSRVKNAMAELEFERGKLHKSLNAAEESCRKLEGLKAEAEAAEKSSLDKYQLLSRENRDFGQEQQTLQKRLTQITKELEQKKRAETELTQEVDRLSSFRKNKDAEKSALQNEITDLKVQEAQQSQIALHQKEKWSQEKARVEELRSSLSVLQSSIEGAGSEVGDQIESAEELDEKAAAAKMQKEKLIRQLAEEKERRQKLQLILRTQEKDLESSRKELSEVSGNLERINVALSRMDVQLDHLMNTLREDYELTFEAAQKDYSLASEPEEARKKVKLIKRAIEELGTVNLAAIEDYQNVREREQFLSEQREDLMKARTTLEHVMTEMDQEVIQRFSKTFHQIQLQFRLVFSELFGGGHADLKLIDSEDLLNSGIEIMAEPPGKKMQKLSLLSGGERALTAIALLFAILKVRPVPFCVLDEVEAALDDANVDRYADFLKKFSAETQFIVVTHRHGTMEHADVLYGVTMQESGISRLVSVRLEETEELIQTGG